MKYLKNHYPVANVGQFTNRVLFNGLGFEPAFSINR